MLRFPSIRALIMSWVTTVSLGSSLTMTFFTLRIDCPPTPTYTWTISCLRMVLSLLMMLVRHWAVLSMLYTTPFRMHDVESSVTTANTVMLPSRFFCPAMPVILDEPSSIATINSFGIGLCDYQFVCDDVAGVGVVSAACFLQMIWLSNSRLMYEYLFHPACERPYL